MHLFLSLLSNILVIFALQSEDSAREENYEAREREKRLLGNRGEEMLKAS